MTTPATIDTFDLDVRVEVCVDQVDVDAVRASGDCTDNGCPPKIAQSVNFPGRTG